MPPVPSPPPPQPDLSPTPWTRKALQDLNTPCQTDGFYVELVSRDDSAYQRFVPIARGTPYSTVPGADTRIIAQYAANPLYFLKQTADVESMRVLFAGQYDNHVLWIWATQTLSQDTYNAKISYPDENVSFPRYERVSTVKRGVWEASPTLAYVSALTALLSVTITGAGTGYGALDANGNVVPTVGTTGAGMALGVIGANGAIVGWVVIVEGSGITGGASLTITGSGTGATATARIQPAGCVLTHQEKRELAESDPLGHDYVQIITTWDTLPGVTLVSSKYDEKTNTVITESKTRKAKGSITPGASDITVGMDHFVQIVEEVAIDDNTAWEVVTLQPRPVAHDLASAIATKKDYVPFEFPATLDSALYVSSVGVLGYNPAFVRRVKQVTLTYWVISTTAPDIDSIMADATVGGILFLGSLFGVIRSGGNLILGTLAEIVYDAVTLAYSGGLTIDWPGSVPDFTDYLADWVGTDAMPTGARFWRGEVNPEGNYFRWRVDLTNVQYLMPSQGTLVP